MKKEWKAYLKRLMKAMQMNEDEFKEFDNQIQADYKAWEKECRQKEGSEILVENGFFKYV